MIRLPPSRGGDDGKDRKAGRLSPGRCLRGDGVILIAAAPACLKCPAAYLARHVSGIRALGCASRLSVGSPMARESTITLIKDSMAHCGSSRAHLDVTAHLIEQSREAAESSQELLERTRRINLSGPIRTADCSAP
jgi:hypothetical protein